MVHGRDSKRFRLRVEAHAVANVDRKTGVLPIFEFSTDLRDQFFRKMRFVVSGLLDGIFFFLNVEAEGSGCSLEL